MLPKQPPPKFERDALRVYGLKRVRNSDAYACLQWSRPDGKAGVYYASERACPWGVYFRTPALPFAVAWTIHFEAALFLLARCEGR
jgi:hypothetical protein